jgi:hypothetical protein
MTKQEIRKTEQAHYAPDVLFRYKGRFLVCEGCKARFRMRHNGTLHYIEPRK